jgi:hypothetical protein
VPWGRWSCIKLLQAWLATTMLCYSLAFTEKEGLAQMRYQGAMTRLKNELLSTRNRAEHELKVCCQPSPG